MRKVPSVKQFDFSRTVQFHHTRTVRRKPTLAVKVLVPKIVLPTEPERSEISFLAVMHALSDPIRLSIVLTVLCEGEKVCGSFIIPAPKSTLSHHFRVLRESGVLSTRRQGKELINSVRWDDLDARFPGLLDAVICGARSVFPSTNTDALTRKTANPTPHSPSLTLRGLHSQEEPLAAQ
jgi:DNA-binding transcriptional ArsR family regulator